MTTQASLIITPNAYQEGSLLGYRPSLNDPNKVIPVEINCVRAAATPVAMRRNKAGVWVTCPANTPRLSWNVGGTQASWLAEPQRTYLNQHDSDYTQAYWVKTGVTISAKSETAPFYLNADALVEDASTGVHGVHPNPRLGGLTIGQAYFVVFYAKKITRDWVYFSDFNGFQVPAVNVWFNLATGFVGTANAGVINPRMESQGNGWYRCSFNFVATGGSGTSCDYRIAASTADNTLNYAGTLNQKSIALISAQAGLGAVIPTPTINTTASTVTINADVISATLPNILPPANSGCVIVKYRPISFTAGVSRIITLTTIDLNNRIFLQENANGTITVFIRNTAGVLWNALSVAVALDGDNIIALNYSQDSSQVWLNGIQILTTTTVISFNQQPNILFVSTLETGAGGANNLVQYVEIHQSKISDALVQAKTTL